MTVTSQPTQPMEIVSFPVEGMTCASCVNRITRFLEKVDGVDGANVNLASESATVRFDPGRVSVADLGAAVDAAGYVAIIDRTSAAHEIAAFQKPRRLAGKVLHAPELVAIHELRSPVT